jgi:hypothetical protein
MLTGGVGGQHGDTDEAHMNFANFEDMDFAAMESAVKVRPLR